MLTLAPFVCLLTLPIITEVPQPAQPPDKQLLKSIVDNIQESQANGAIKTEQLTVTVHSGRVSVTGQIDSADEARPILSAVTTVEGVNSLQLNLGIGRPPFLSGPPYPYLPSAAWRPPPQWEDGGWTDLYWGDQRKR